MTSQLRNTLQYLFFFGLGVLFVWLSVKDINAEEYANIKAALANAKYLLAIPVFFLLLLGHYVRALRWRLLMEPLGYFPSKANTFFAVMIGYLVNQGVPRLGEVVKCTVLAKYEKVPADKLVGTIILERLIDALSLLAVFAITLLIQPGLYGKLVSDVFKKSENAEEGGIPLWIILVGVLLLIVIIVAIWMRIKKKSFADLREAIKGIIRRVWDGLISIRHLKRRLEFIVLTILLWAIYLSGGYIGFQALEATQQYGIPEAFTVLSAGSIGMIVTPGGIGGYPLLIERTMILYGLQMSIATAFGWLLWIAQTLVVLVGGVASFILLPIVNRRRAVRQQQ